MKKITLVYLGAALCVLFLTFTGCSTSKVLVGQIRPVEEHSDEVRIPKLEEWSPHFVVISQSDDMNSSHSDAAWQSTKTASIISFNSACRDFMQPESNLKTVTDTLLAPWRNLKILDQKTMTVSGKEALVTTGQGRFLDRMRKFQTLVIKSERCFYDLNYLSPVNTFDSELSLFHRFRDNLLLK